ncbi:MAG: hypothetical protein ACTHWH_08285 [Marinobacter sp.]
MTAPTLPRFNKLSEGQFASVERRFTADDLTQWSKLAGLNESPTAVPEPLISGLFSFLLGMELPGKGTNYLKQSLTFEELAQTNEPLTATVEVSRLRSDKALVNLTTVCTGINGRVICKGEALVLYQC